MWASLLQQHLQSQRDDAIRLIARHNAMLAALMGAGPDTAVCDDSPASAVSERDQPKQAAEGRRTPRQRGKVISLFDYTNTSHTEVAKSPEDSEHPAYQVLDESNSAHMTKWGETVRQLLCDYGADDALAINRKQMAPAIFLNAGANGLFYFKQQFGVLFAVCYVGADAHYAETLHQLKLYADSEGLLINLMAHENRVEVLKQAGFSTTPMGIWQRIEPVADFTLAGSSMRRLRYLVNKYSRLGACRTEAYQTGSDASTDEAICGIIDAWCELKETVPNFIDEVKQRVRQGAFDEDHRFFLTWRDDKLDNVMVFSRDNLNDGYLMDLEFYAEGLPLGSTEYALSEIIKIFTSEGRRVASLGLTMGTGLHEHDNASADVQALFESLRKADYLNGDANAQYKNKYRPVTTTMYLARPHDAGKKKLNDLMMLLGTG